MIITRLIGGLGNQMFQYAAGRSLSYKMKCPLKIDISGYDRYKLHNYSLKYFDIKAGETGGSDGLSIYREKEFHYDEDFSKIESHVYLTGYWQTEKYFENIRGIILDEFTLKDSYYNKQFEKNVLAIKSTYSCSIHIRRGDYVTNPAANNVHGTCSIDYYREAVNKILEHEPETKFFVFSDDIPWAKENLSFIKNAHFFSGNENYIDIILMSYCDYNIIANSSFSWWGAWLNDSKDKKVIAPKKWFNNSINNTKDILPKEWSKI